MHPIKKSLFSESSTFKISRADVCPLDFRQSQLVWATPPSPCTPFQTSSWGLTLKDRLDPAAALPTLPVPNPPTPRSNHLYLASACSAATHSPPKCLYFAFSDVTSSPRLLSLRQQTDDSGKSHRAYRRPDLLSWDITHTHTEVLAPQGGDGSAATVTASEPTPKMRAGVWRNGQWQSGA